MFQNIAFDRRQQTGKLLIQNARGGRSISWHVAFLRTWLTVTSPARQHCSLRVPVPNTRLLGDRAQHGAVLPCMPALLSASWHRPLDYALSDICWESSISADVGQCFDAEIWVFDNILVAESQKGETFRQLFWTIFEGSLQLNYCILC